MPQGAHPGQDSATMAGKTYLSCIYLEQGLNIYKDSMTHCCIPHSNGKGNVKIGDFSGDRLPIEMINQSKRELIGLNQTDADTPCKGCHMLVRRKWDSGNLLKYVTINDWYKCNLKCCYCFTQTESGVEHMKKERTHDTEALFRDMVENGYLAPDAMIHWGGGEVAVYSHFEPIARLLQDNNISQLVNTNALVYSEVIKNGLARRNMVVQISMDAGTRETYRAVKGVDGFEAVCKNLAKYSSAGHLLAKYIFLERNNGVDDVDGFLEQCIKAGVKEIVPVPETTELVSRKISDKTLDAAARMMAAAMRRGIVFDGSCSAFGPEYGPLLLERLKGLLGSGAGWMLLRTKIKRLLLRKIHRMT